MTTTAANMTLGGVTTSGSLVVHAVTCEAPRRHQPQKHCGSLIAVRTEAGWEVVCPTCKEKMVLPV